MQYRKFSARRVLKTFYFAATLIRKHP